MIARLALTCLLCCISSMAAYPQPPPPTLEPREWAAYRERFVDESGRVIDDANGNISHSESQGYGLLLAWHAGERADFERIWSFTETNLMLRDDGLAVWKWDPDGEPRITDPNNASDGDLLIAYALSLAGGGWGEDRFTRRARDIAEALAKHAIFELDGRVLLRPGVVGFGVEDRPDGPVVNLSYWVFEALPVLARLAPEGDWAGLERDGLALLHDAAFGNRKLPPDWLSVAGEPKPAEGFPAEFSYNAVRIPLYMLRAREEDTEMLQRLRDGMTGDNGGVALVDLETGEVKDELMDAGYRIIPALAQCAVDGTPLPDDLRRFEPTLYYPSTLHLLALAHVREARPECL